MNGIKVGNKISKYPIIQGGMGVGVSLHNLAGSVSREGGIGIISTADIGYKEPDFDKNPKEATLRAIGKEIKLAREIAGDDKILGVNIMVALEDYANVVTECVKQKIDLIISGAGIPKDLPQYVVGSDTKIAPIVSSLRCLQLIVKHWMNKYNYLPDMVVIEGPKAGGHLGFKREELGESTEPKLEDITRDVVAYVKEIGVQYNKEIPVIVAGGVWDKDDIKKFMDLGATGVQMATRFVATNECDASESFKMAYVNAKESDVKIIKSPVGMPGRAIYNDFIRKTEEGKYPITKCYKCIKTCNISSSPYCITKALINAVKGNLNEGLIFCGSNVGRVDKIVPVAELIKELVAE